MAQKNKNEPWLLITFTALVVVAGIFYAFLFPREAFDFLSQYWQIITPILIIVIILYLTISFTSKYKQRREQQNATNRDKHIKIAEQLIWRGRYSLESQKAQILSDNDPESHHKWSEVKRNYIRTKLYPVVSEQQVPVSLASALIENTLSGNRFRTGRLPTYGVTDVDDQFN